MRVAITAAAVTGCGGGPAESAASRPEPLDPRPDSLRLPVPTFGPESLQVAFIRVPDSVAVTGNIAVTAVAYNRTNRWVVVPLACAASGLSVRVVDARGDARALTGAPCEGGQASTPAPVAPGDSVAGSLAGPAPAEAGSFRLRASYVAGTAQSAVVERPLLVRYAFNCVDDARVVPALQVSVSDAATGGPTSTPSSVVAADGDFSAPLGPGPGRPGDHVPVTFYGLMERAGTYTVTVTAAGYVPWRQENVVVTRGPDCHVLPALLTARLARSP